MPNKVKFKWTDVEQKTFKEIRNIVTGNTLLDYPDSNKIFEIHNIDRNFQLGEVIRQEVKPISFYIIKKLNLKKIYGNRKRSSQYRKNFERA